MTSAPDPTRRSLLLDNGLTVLLRHVPGARQAAAVVRVAAGSHDEPATWPGLAHFLEHLLFLGGHGYPAEQRLMPFIQACGGRLNASTQAHHTDYFFELPPPALDDGLARLMDMLANPQLEVDAQLREREVLQAEYQARAADAATLAQSALAAALVPGHPLADFHAGNRASLMVEDPAFQRALALFHRSHYQGARMRLVLLGPQSLDELAELARRHAGPLPAGAPASPPPASPLLPLFSHSLRMRLPGAPRYWLAFALEGQPATLPQAVDLLCELLQDEADGSLQAWLGEHGLCDGLQLSLPYLDQGQALLVLDIALADTHADSRARLEAALFHWLSALREQEPWEDLLARHQMRTGPSRQSPLEQARSLMERDPDHAALDGRSLHQLLSQLSPPRLVRLFASEAALHGRVEVAGFQLELEEAGIPAWPAIDARWRFAGVPVFSPFAVPAALGALGEVPLIQHPGEAERAALFLRWRLPAGLSTAGFYPALQRGLRSTQSRAQQQGISLDFIEQGRDWRLALRGAAEMLPAVLDATLKVLLEPPLAACDQGLRLHRAWLKRQAAELPIRQLLQHLPDVLDAAAPRAEVARAVTPARLAGHWSHVAWDVMAVGLDAGQRELLHGVLRRLPGQRLPRDHAPAVLAPTHRWHRPAAVEGEAALLLFCPLPDRHALTEASWQWLARCLEADFYQRLRSELQLGYAVLSGFRLINAQAGLLFGVQSPSATVAEVLEHIETFLAGLGASLGNGEAARQALLVQLRDGGEDEAERVWNLHLAGRAPDWPERVADALEQATHDDLRNALQALQQGHGGWRVLANDECPDSRWH